MQIPVCVMGSNRQGRDHGLFGASSGHGLSQSERSALKQYTMAVYSAFKDPRKVTLPCIFMGLFPLSAEGNARWALAYSDVQEHTPTGVLTQTLTAIIDQSVLHSGHDRLSQIYTALGNHAQTLERKNPEPLRVNLRASAHTIPAALLEIAAFKAGKITGLHVADMAADGGELYFQWFDANRILFGTQPQLCSAPVKVQSESGWAIKDNLKLRMGGELPKGYIPLNRAGNAWTIPNLGLDQDVKIWCQICSELSQVKTARNPVSENYKPISTSRGLADMIWNIKNYGADQIIITFSNMISKLGIHSGGAVPVKDAIGRIMHYAGQERTQARAQRNLNTFFDSFERTVPKDFGAKTDHVALNHVIAKNALNWIMTEPLSAKNNHLLFGLALDGAANSEPVQRLQSLEPDTT